MQGGEDPIDLFTNQGWNIRECCIEPLMHLEDTGESLRVTMDLPDVKKEDIDVIVTDKTLEVRAKMRRTYKFSRWGTVQRSVEFKSFKKIITLPTTIDPNKVASRFKQGILEVILPKKQTTKRIKIT